MSRYLPIRSEKSEFRPLKIHRHSPPTSEIDESFDPNLIRCDFCLASRDSPPEYSALSYTWGDVSTTVPIQIDGQIFEIGQNLHSALQHIRQEQEDVMFWADAVCINQNDDVEKNDQVLHMKEIFALAKQTIVWLGPAGDESDEFLKWCKEIRNKLTRQITADGVLIPGIDELMLELIFLRTDTETGAKRYEELRSMLEALVRRIDEAERALSFHAAALHLMNRDYWKRVWIRQEFVVSPVLVFQCGNVQIDLPSLRNSFLYRGRIVPDVLNSLHNKEMSLVENLPASSRLKWATWVLDGYPENDHDPDLAETINIMKQVHFLQANYFPSLGLFGARHVYHAVDARDRDEKLAFIRILAGAFVDANLEASDPRDRIFALLGMASDQEKLELTPNYDKLLSETEVFEQAARAIIGAGHVDLLSFCQHRDSPGQKESRLPSWVPDWSKSISRPSGRLPSDTTFAASSDKLFERSADLKKVNPRQIALRGWILDNIEKLPPAWIEPDKRTSENRENIIKFLCDVFELSLASNAKFKETGHEIYAFADDRETACIFTPIAGQELDSLGFVQKAGRCSLGAFPNLVNELCPSPSVDLTRDQKLAGAMYVEGMRYQKTRRPFLSSSGYVGLVPNLAKPGDVIVVFCGAKFPYVLRSNEDGTYKFVGDAYVHGIMYGEFMAIAGEKKTFVLE